MRRGPMPAPELVLRSMRNNNNMRLFSKKLKGIQ
jgi:hypothetical protein